MENERRSLWRKVAGPAVHALTVPTGATAETALMGLLVLESFD